MQPQAKKIWLKIGPIKVRYGCDNNAIEMRYSADKIGRFLIHTPNLSPWLRDGVFAFLTLCHPNRLCCHISLECNSLPLQGSLL